MMNEPEDLVAIIAAVLQRAPEWIRADLVAKEPTQRRRAEDALAAMIGASIAKQGQVSVDAPRHH